MKDRMPPLDPASMNDAQRKAAEALIAGPRKAVVGPFIPLLRSPELLDRLQRVGEYLRFQSSVPQRLNEWAILVASRHWGNQFEWALHHPLALKAGVARENLDALARRQAPPAMTAGESTVYAVATELLERHFVSDATYERAREQLGEQGIVDLVACIGYFTTVDLLMNAVHTPAPPSDVPPLPD